MIIKLDPNNSDYSVLHFLDYLLCGKPSFSKMLPIRTDFCFEIHNKLAKQTFVPL